MHLLSHRVSSLLYQVRRILRVVGWKKKEIKYKINEILCPLNEVRPFQVCWFLQGFYIQYKRFKMLFHFKKCRSVYNLKAQRPEIQQSSSSQWQFREFL